MSVQVSYKKQITFYIILILIIFSAVEIVAQTYVKPKVFEGCADRITASKIYPDYVKSDLISLCKDYYETNVFMSDDRSIIMPFPSQHSNAVNINSLGLRGGEVTLEKPKDVTRIVMLGGSTTFGWYALGDNGSMPTYLQKRIDQNKNLGKIEVINGGLPSAGSLFETKFLREIQKLQPDIVIVYDGYNDITNPLPADTPGYKMQLQLFFKQLDSYSYTPRAVQKVLHELDSNIYEKVNKKPNTGTAHFTEEDFTKRADLWEKNWSAACDEFVSKDLKIVVFLQPYLGTSNRTMSEYEAKIFNEDAMRVVEHYSLFKEKIPKIVSHCTMVIDMSDAFEKIDVPIFADLAHTGHYANEIIADKIYEKILPIIS